METLTSIADLHDRVARRRDRGQRIGFVPTMGNLHAGHLRLIEHARAAADVVVASIYVNPLQFGPSEDFSAYPRTLEADRERLAGAGAQLLFAPGDVEIYPRGPQAQTTVEVPGVSDILCGRFRPGHFRGVTTVVNRLLNLVQPHVAVFGKKDYQQLLVIRLMVEDLGMPVAVEGVETVREPDGLACSSRNAYLDAAQRRVAPRLYATLQDVATAVRSARGAGREDLERARERLSAAGFRPEYLEVRRRSDLAPAGSGDRELVVLGAAWLGRTRLIDNLEVSLNGKG
jgi:pantoate--beta-alanine ligase